MLRGVCIYYVRFIGLHAPLTFLKNSCARVQSEDLVRLRTDHADLQAEDTAILHAALKTNGTLTVDACARIMKLPRDQNSWPLPRSAKHISVRLDWLLTRLLSGSKQA